MFIFKSIALLSIFLQERIPDQKPGIGMSPPEQPLNSVAFLSSSSISPMTWLNLGHRLQSPVLESNFLNPS